MCLEQIMAATPTWLLKTVQAMLFHSHSIMCHTQSLNQGDGHLNAVCIICATMLHLHFLFALPYTLCVAWHEHVHGHGTYILFAVCNLHCHFGLKSAYLHQSLAKHYLVPKEY